MRAAVRPGDLSNEERTLVGVELVPEP